MAKSKAILRYDGKGEVPTVRSKTGLPRSSLYSLISRGLFVKPVALGPRTAGWPDDEVDALNAARIANKSDDEVRALVQRLEAARKVAG